jgi:hypothetical protein
MMKIVNLETFRQMSGPLLFAYKNQPWALQIKSGSEEEHDYNDSTRYLWDLDTNLTGGDNSGGIHSKELEINKDERMYIDCENWDREWDNEDGGCDAEECDEGFIVFEEYEVKEIIGRMIEDLKVDDDADWVNSISVRRMISNKEFGHYGG